MGASATVKRTNKTSYCNTGSGKSAKKSGARRRKGKASVLSIILAFTVVIFGVYFYINGYAKFANVGYERTALKRELLEQQRLNSTLNAEYIRLKSPGRLAEFAQAANMTDRSDRDHIRESDLIASSFEYDNQR